MSVQDVEQEILERVARGLHERLGGVSSEDARQLDPAWIAAAMLSAMPAAHPFERLGPFFDTAGLVSWLGISRQAIHQKVAARQILAPTTADDQRVYPAWQFSPSGTMLPGLVPVLKVLLAATDPWTAALWLTAPSEVLGGRSAVDTLGAATAGEALRHAEAILNDARSDAARWAL